MKTGATHIGFAATCLECADVREARVVLGNHIFQLCFQHGFGKKLSISAQTHLQICL